MHGFLYTFLIAFANNADNIGVCIAYCIRGIKLGILQNLWISFMTFLISSIFAMLGTFLTGFINKTACNYICMVMLVCMGIWIIFEPYIKKLNIFRKKANTHGDSIINALKHPEESDIDNSHTIDFKEATLLGISLSINNTGASLNGGMIGLNVYLIGFLSALVNFIALFAGNYFSKFFIRLELGNKASVISGIILIVIGILQVI